MIICRRARRNKGVINYFEKVTSILINLKKMVLYTENKEQSKTDSYTQDHMFSAFQFQAVFGLEGAGNRKN